MATYSVFPGAFPARVAPGVAEGVSSRKCCDTSLEGPNKCGGNCCSSSLECSNRCLSSSRRMRRWRSAKTSSWITSEDLPRLTSVGDRASATLCRRGAKLFAVSTLVVLEYLTTAGAACSRRPPPATVNSDACSVEHGVAAAGQSPPVPPPPDRQRPDPPPGEAGGVCVALPLAAAGAAIVPLGYGNLPGPHVPCSFSILTKKKCFRSASEGFFRWMP